MNPARWRVGLRQTVQTLQTVLFRPSGPHQCSADAEMKAKL